MLISTWGSTFGFGCIRMMVYYFSSMWSSFCREICNRRLKSGSLRGFCLTRADIWLWHTWLLCVDIKFSLFILFRPSSVNYTVHCWVLSSKIKLKGALSSAKQIKLSEYWCTGTVTACLPVEESGSWLEAVLQRYSALPVCVKNTGSWSWPDYISHNSIV